MILINLKQVEWLIKYQNETTHTIVATADGYTKDYHYFYASTQELDGDLDYLENGVYEYYLNPETYNSLPQQFKDLK